MKDGGATPFSFSTSFYYQEYKKVSTFTYHLTVAVKSQSNYQKRSTFNPLLVLSFGVLNIYFIFTFGTLMIRVSVVPQVLEDDDVTVSLTGRASWPSDSRRHGGGSQTKGDSGDVSPSNTRHIRFHPKQERMNCVMFLEQNKNS